MGKVKSTIITVIVTLIVVVLLLFTVISCPLPGGVERYNSILSNIHLGSEFTGDAYTTVLPEGVITAERYELGVTEEDQADYVQVGSYYVEKETLAEYSGDESVALELFKDTVAADAEVLAKRFGAMEYTSYSVAVVDGVAIKVSLASNFTYAAYSGNDNDSYTDELSVASSSISYLTLGGELTLRNQDSTITSRIDEDYGSTGSLLGVRADISDYIKSISVYSSGGTYAVRIKLTSDGEDIFYSVSQKVANSDDTYIRFFVGKTNIINLTCESVIEDSSFYIQVDDLATAQNYASLLDSVSSGDALSLVYEYSEVTSSTSAYGNYTALLTAIAMIIVLVGIMAYSIVRYKKLGIVLSLMIVAFALILVIALFFMETTLTAAGLFVALLCLVLFVGSNYWSYEMIKKELAVGRTVQNAVKTGYKKTVAGILDLHIVLFFAGAFLTFIATGEAAACGTVLVICTLASYCLHWFTRFMWYVTMSPVKSEADKRKFLGAKAKSFEEMEEEYERAAQSNKVNGEV